MSVLLLNGCDPSEARLLLHRAAGNLRRALELMTRRGSDAA
jgi:hypothetical protein